MNQPGNDIYQIPASGTEQRNYCGGNLTSENESCVTIGAIPAAPGVFIIGDSKPGGAGQQLRFTKAELDTFVLGYASEHGITL